MACAPLQLATAAHFDNSTQARQWMQAPAGEQTSYRRHGNSSVLQLEATFAALERGAACIAVSSGMAASVLVAGALLRSGEHVVLPANVFYETGAQFQHLASSMGVSLTRVTGGSVPALLAGCRPNTRMILVESPANPGLATLDLRTLAAACHLRGILLVVDNTLLTPLAQNVLDLGAHISLYSLSKHLAGHGDVMGGMVCTRHPELHQSLVAWRTCAGNALDPFSAWLALRGLRTLALRLRRHAANAHAIAAMLRRQFAWLDWTGAWNGADARRNRVRTRLHTGLMALRFAHRGQGGAFVDALQNIPVLPSFGNPETGVFHYGGVVEDADALAACEIPAGLVRLSVGIEDPRDLLAALVPALRRVS